MSFLTVVLFAMVTAQFCICVSPPTVSAKFQWTDSIPASIPVCPGQSLTLDWSFSRPPTSKILSQKWLFKKTAEGSESNLATLVDGQIHIKNRISDIKLELVPGSKTALRLHNITAKAAGIYSVRLILEDQDVERHVRSVTLVSTDTPVTVDNARLQASFEGGHYMEDDKQHHTILACGTVNEVWRSRIQMIWKTPDKKFLPSSYTKDGWYFFVVPNPFVRGEYRCNFDPKSEAKECVSQTTQLATITISGMQSRMAIMESKMDQLALGGNNNQTTQSTQAQDKAAQAKLKQEVKKTVSDGMKEMKQASAKASTDIKGLQTKNDKMAVQVKGLKTMLDTRDTLITAMEKKDTDFAAKIEALQDTDKELAARISKLEDNKDQPFDTTHATAFLRLANGTNAHEGRLEIQISTNGPEWGTICDDNFQNVDAKVACRLMGFPSEKAVALQQDSAELLFGKGTGSVLLDSIDCKGDEESFLDCGHDVVSFNDCSHDEDVQIRCA